MLDSRPRRHLDCLLPAAVAPALLLLQLGWRILRIVKEEIGIELDMDQLDFDAFNSVDSFVDLVMRQTEQAA